MSFHLPPRMISLVFAICAAGCIQTGQLDSSASSSGPVENPPARIDPPSLNIDNTQRLDVEMASLARALDTVKRPEKGQSEPTSSDPIRSAGAVVPEAAAEFPSPLPVSTAADAPNVRGVAAPSSADLVDARKEIIAISLARYPGPCPCPYNVMRNNRRCGGNSAWSKPGGLDPICYDSDITTSDLDNYFRRKGRIFQQ